MTTIAKELERAVYDILTNDLPGAWLGDVCMRVDTTVMGNTVRVEILICDNTGDISRRVFFVHPRITEVTV